MKVITKRSQTKVTMVFIEFKEFYVTLFKTKVLRHTMRRIGPKNHNLGTYETRKRSLSCFSDKRYILKNGINTLGYGHIDIYERII